MKKYRMEKYIIELKDDAIFKYLPWLPSSAIEK